MYALGCDPYLYGIDNQPASAPSVSRCSKLRVQRLGLLDQLVGAREQRRRDRQPERLGDLDVNDQLELSRLLDGEVGGLGTLEDLVHDGGSPPEEEGGVRPVRHQAPRIWELTQGVHGRQAAASSQ